MGQVLGALTLGHGAGLPSNGAGGPDLPQRIAKDCREVICICGLMSPSGKALLLHALQRAIGRRNWLAVQGAWGAMLAVLGDVDDLAIGVQGLPVDLYAILADLVPCTEVGVASAIHNGSATYQRVQPTSFNPPLLQYYSGCWLFGLLKQWSEMVQQKGMSPTGSHDQWRVVHVAASR